MAITRRNPALCRYWAARSPASTAARLEADRAAGTARSDVDLDTLARVLVGVIFAAMEDDVRDLHAGRPRRPHLVSTVYDVWRRSAYLESARPGPDAAD